MVSLGGMGHLVGHLNEEEALGWGGGASGLAVSFGENEGDLIRVETASAAFDEGAYEVADHVVEEAGAGYAVAQDGWVRVLVEDPS